MHTLFRDAFNRRVMALVMGTFTYCLVVLRSVRSSLEEGGNPVIPNISVALAVLLGIATVLAGRRVHQPQRAHDGRQRDPGADPP